MESVFILLKKSEVRLKKLSIDPTGLLKLLLKQSMSFQNLKKKSKTGVKLKNIKPKINIRVHILTRIRKCYKNIVYIYTLL